MGRKALDVLKDIADHLGWSQPVTIENVESLPKDTRKLLRGLNRVLRAVSALNDWRFLRAEGTIDISVAEADGTVDLTSGDATVTGTSTAFTQAMVGRAFIVEAHPFVYRVLSVASDTELELDKSWSGDTDTELNYKIVQDRYDLPLDYDRPINDQMQLFADSSSLSIRIIDADQLRSRRINRLPYSTNDPDAACLWPNDSQGEHRQIVFDPFPDTARRVQHDYQKVHPEITLDTERILFPPNVEEMIMAGLEYLMLRGPDDDQRAQLMLGQFLNEYQSGVARREVGSKRLRLSASRERALQQVNWLRRRGRRIDWGKAFDRADFHDLPQ